ncbi:MAG: putative NAD-dependent epimerase/dehydratase [Frankiales bacterium]|nr:putative NAD-dependent epimerase/dehydratase [Frankiales bacterium]
MKVVVTGGAGFIGAHLTRALVDEGTRVVVVDDMSSGCRANLEGVVGADIEELSVLEPALAQVCVGADAIVHLAARPSVPRSLVDPRATHDANVTGTLNLLEAARQSGCQHVVLASSSSVYGDDPTLPKHEALLPRPLSPYAASKLAGEAYTLAYARCFGVPSLTFRFFNVFGPLQPADHAYAAVIPSLLSRAMAGLPVVLHGDGQQTRDFTYVGSVTAVIVEALRRRVVHETPVNLAFGGRHSLLEVVRVLEGILGGDIVVRHAPARGGDVRHSQASTELLARLFPSLSPVTLEDGLRRTVSWWTAASARASGSGAS